MANPQYTTTHSAFTLGQKYHGVYANPKLAIPKPFYAPTVPSNSSSRRKPMRTIPAISQKTVSMATAKRM